MSNSIVLAELSNMRAFVPYVFLRVGIMDDVQTFYLSYVTRIPDGFYISGEPVQSNQNGILTYCLKFEEGENNGSPLYSRYEIPIPNEGVNTVTVKTIVVATDRTYIATLQLENYRELEGDPENEVSPEGILYKKPYGYLSKIELESSVGLPAGRARHRFDHLIQLQEASGLSYDFPSVNEGKRYLALKLDPSSPIYQSSAFVKTLDLKYCPSSNETQPVSPIVPIDKLDAYISDFGSVTVQVQPQTTSPIIIEYADADEDVITAPY